MSKDAPAHFRGPLEKRGDIVAWVSLPFGLSSRNKWVELNSGRLEWSIKSESSGGSFIDTKSEFLASCTVKESEDHELEFSLEGDDFNFIFRVPDPKVVANAQICHSRDVWVTKFREHIKIAEEMQDRGEDPNSSAIFGLSHKVTGFRAQQGAIEAATSPIGSAANAAAAAVTPAEVRDGGRGAAREEEGTDYIGAALSLAQGLVSGASIGQSSDLHGADGDIQ